ncbi:SpoIVB peptidase [Oceanobacillus caeni]|uniref:Peptidase S55 n=1 Tax=Oceanobacillus caeni TaxID=405946 RepID=A0ABR5MKN5_9BACI|nr:SpoIVB peptidase [Oceanobacillus caeni]KPH76395.1 peptidase S55 [Oceanobacillus caeni]MCR1834422.1 SpoIVB peptidase [Oceanobacillus caeni]
MKIPKLNTVRQLIGVILLLVFVTFPFITPINKYFSIPSEVVTLNNENPIELPQVGENVTVSANSDHVEAIDNSMFYAGDSGSSELVYEVNGFPIKKVNLSVLEDIQVIPGGQSIGVQLQTRGVLVVGHHLVNTNDKTVSPGEEAKINVGDVIVKINDNPIKEMNEIKDYVVEAGEKNKDLNITVKRGKEFIETKLEPILDDKENEYKIGLYIRDSAAGIGTMTFFEPQSKKYGALGHIISDMDTKKPVEINDGTIVRSSVTSIEKGNNGIPGEKQAKFSSNQNVIGNITKNSPFGIFGKLNEDIKNGKYDKPMPIALSHEVKEGPAKILTVVDGEKVEEYDIEIISSVPQKYPATKGMVIQITDEKLLEKTGGIVQGMSGSPIIQDGKVIGAVTHVFVNDPTSGYGVHIEWMLQDAGIDIYDNKKEAS